MGIERLLMEMESQNVNIPIPDGPDIYIASLGQKASAFASKLVYQLRCAGINAEGDLLGRSLKSQMKYADKLGFAFAVVIGDNEIETNKAILRNMKTGEQKNVSLDSILNRLKNR